jgi:hypothetical protein
MNIDPMHPTLAYEAQLRRDLEAAAVADMMSVVSTELLPDEPERGVRLLLDQQPESTKGQPIVIVCGPSTAPGARRVVELLGRDDVSVVEAARPLAQQHAFTGWYEEAKPEPVDWAKVGQGKQDYERQHAPRFRDTKPVTTPKARKAARRRQRQARKAHR